MQKITEKSDVYNYGVVVLEVLTGKQPIDPTIPDGQHVVDWVRRHKGDAGVLDLALQGRSDTEVEQMLQVMGVALLCVIPVPDERPTMKDVAAMLKEIRLEREEYAKVGILLKGDSCGSPAKDATPTTMPVATTSTSSTPPCWQGHGSSAYNSYNNSFSAVYSSS